MIENLINVFEQKFNTFADTTDAFTSRFVRDEDSAIGTLCYRNFNVEFEYCLECGGIIEKTFRPTEKFPQARIERVDMQYLYSDGDLYNFMNNETYDQIAIGQDTVGDSLKFVKENETVKVCSYNGSVFAIEAPLFVELEITDTEPGFAGNTAQGATKPAVVETGATVYVPLFVNQGDVIKIDTRTGEYLSRV